MEEQMTKKMTGSMKQFRPTLCTRHKTDTMRKMHKGHNGQSRLRLKKRIKNLMS